MNSCFLKREAFCILQAEQFTAVHKCHCEHWESTRMHEMSFFGRCKQYCYPYSLMLFLWKPLPASDPLASLNGDSFDWTTSRKRQSDWKEQVHCSMLMYVVKSKYQWSLIVGIEHHQDEFIHFIMCNVILFRRRLNKISTNFSRS